MAIGVRVNFTISGITGAFENLTDNFFNDLLNLSGPEILELAWPGLEPAVVEIVGDVSISRFFLLFKHGFSPGNFYVLHSVYLNFLKSFFNVKIYGNCR